MMDAKKLEQLAREAGGVLWVHPMTVPKPIGWAFEPPESLARFAALVRAEALEEAAKVCEEYAARRRDKHESTAIENCAEDIRALKEEA